MSNYKAGDKFILEIDKIECDGWIRFCIHNDYIKLTENTIDKMERLDNSEYINENFGELQDEAYKAGREAGQEEAIKWSKRNEEDMYNAGLNDAWELAKKIMLGKDEGGVSYKVLFAVYGTSDIEEILNYSPEEALARFEAYGKEQAEIKVGDVVRYKRNPLCEVLITATSRGLNGVHLQTDRFGRIGEVNSCISRERIEKTGKHIDIQSILEQLGGASE